MFQTLQLDRVGRKDLLLFDGSVRRATKDETGEWKLDELLSYLPFGAPILHTRPNASVAVADIDRDSADTHIDEIITYAPPRAPSVIKIIPPQSESEAYSYVLSTPFAPPSAPPPAYPLVVAADVDHDGIYGRYTGDVTTHLSDNQLIAVIAAPPCAEGIGQDLTACESSISLGESNGWTHSVTIEVHESVGIGFDIELQGSTGVVANVGTTVHEFEGVLLFTLSLNFEYTTSKIYSRTVSFFATHEDHQVVFSTIPYDRYHYEILTHYDPELIGRTFYVAVPYSPKIYSVTRSYYEATRQPEEVAVDSNIIASTPGDLWSYPHPADYDTWQVGKDIIVRVQEMLVAEGAKTSLSGTYSYSTTHSISLGIEAEYSMKECLNWFCLHQAVGGGLAYAATYNIGSEIGFSGTVGGLQGDYHTTYKYQFGLVGYRKELYVDDDPSKQKIQDFLVLDFLVVPPAIRP